MPCKIEAVTSTSITVSFSADAADDGDTYIVGVSALAGGGSLYDYFWSRNTAGDYAQIGEHTYTFTISELAPENVYHIRSYIFSDSSEIMAFGDMRTVTTGDFVDEEIVDLGLSVKWRGWNLGATKPQEAGLFYQWGDTQGYGSDVTDGKYFAWGDPNGSSAYKWCNGSDRTLTKYCNYSPSGDNGFTDNKTSLDEEDDAVRTALGDGWRMPTISELSEFSDNTHEFVGKLRGIPGYFVFSTKEGYRDKYLFLPKVGNRYEDKYNIDDDALTYYWTSSLNGCTWAMAYTLGKDKALYGQTPRCYGALIRPVTK